MSWTPTCFGRSGEGSRRGLTGLVGSRTPSPLKGAASEVSTDDVEIEVGSVCARPWEPLDRRPWWSQLDSRPAT